MFRFLPMSWFRRSETVNMNNLASQVGMQADFSRAHPGVSDHSSHRQTSRSALALPGSTATEAAAARRKSTDPAHRHSDDATVGMP
ncbi:hypothetical protein R0381_000584 [Jeongeupia wiesaeckerbachi]|uniref:hypothetical protein n=1 Tax=Jeongeupia wiesaeckerbachi TaxID=3051218 RepID=UPI003D801DFF